MNDSVIALNKCRGVIEKYLIQGDIYTVEESDNEVLILLDSVSGIDYINKNDFGLRGIAARCQWVENKKPFNSFTIRSIRKTGAITEFEKRINQINNGYLYPALTLQAYFDNRQDNNLLSVAVIHTKVLYDILKHDLSAEYPRFTRINESDNQFYYIKWFNIQPYIRYWFANPAYKETLFDKKIALDVLKELEVA